MSTPSIVEIDDRTGEEKLAMPIDPGTGLVILGGAVGGAQLIQRLLGPTADYLGEGIKSWTEVRIHNTQRIFASAERKLGERIDEEGSVPPRVLKGILSEGSYCDDELTVEYFGGILASSRSSVSRDDRGTTLVALLSQLSTYQIRMHYICYSVMKEVNESPGSSLGLHETRQKLTTFIPMEKFHAAFEFDEQELRNVGSIISHAIWGLHATGLIEGGYGYGDPDDLRIAMPGPGVYFQPSGLGIELYLWAHGFADTDIDESFDVMSGIELLSDIPINVEGAQFIPVY